MNELRWDKLSPVISGLGLAGVAGGFASIAFTFVYAFTHGTTTVNKMESLLGMNELEWGQIGAIVPLLLVAAVFAFRLRMRDRITKLVRIGLWTASIGMALRVISEIPQFFIDMRTEYQSLLGISSWYLYLLSLPLLMIGMFLAGIGCRRSGMSGSAFYATLFLGLLIIPTLWAGGIISGMSDDSTVYRLSFGLLSVPQGLAWVWLATLTPYAPNKTIASLVK